MERYLISMSLLLLLLASCGGNKTKNADEEVVADTLQTDTTAVDSLEAVMESMPVPKAATRSFRWNVSSFPCSRIMAGRRR